MLKHHFRVTNNEHNSSPCVEKDHLDEIYSSKEKINFIWIATGSGLDILSFKHIWVVVNEPEPSSSY